MIALALACDPELVIADEPTTALDVVMQAQVLQLLERLRERLGLALILISHDLGVLAETCDRIAVMYAGRIVETGPVRTVFKDPQHPYTKLLLDSLPVIGGERGLAPPIPGGPPDPGNPPEGCNFHPRCPYAQDECLIEPAAEGPRQRRTPRPATSPPGSAGRSRGRRRKGGWPMSAVAHGDLVGAETAPLMEVRDLAIEFRSGRKTARALDGVSLEWRRGEILGVVGSRAAANRRWRGRCWA